MPTISDIFLLSACRCERHASCLRDRAVKAFLDGDQEVAIHLLKQSKEVMRLAEIDFLDAMEYAE